MLVHWLIFSGFVSHYDNRERAVMFDYDTKEKEHQKTRQSDLYSGATPPRTNQIASCFGALSITKCRYSRGTVFRGSRVRVHVRMHFFLTL
jgi:hypothetical protein